MILRSIQVEGWRCFADVIDVGRLGDGLNVIHGPNGSGKSTLLWALARGLFDSYKVTGADIESLRPWGRQLTPRVRIEFAHNGTDYRLEKQFLDNPKSRLARLEEKHFVPLAEAGKADDLVRELLSAEPPKRGACDDRHWGFAQVLWATQGALRIERLSDGTRNSIHDSLGAQLAGPGGEAIEQRIATLYNGIYTPTGKLKGGASAPPIVALRTSLDTLQERRSKLAARLAEFDAASRMIEDLRSARDQSQQDADGLEKELATALELAKKYNDLAAACDTLAERVKNARNEYEQLEERVKAIGKLRKREQECRDDLAKIADTSATVDNRLKQCEQEAKAAREVLSTVRKRRAETEQQERVARQAKTFSEANSAAEKLSGRIEAIQAAITQHDDIQKRRGELIAPNSCELKKIERAARERDAARLRLDAALIEVTIDAETPLEVEIVDADNPGNRNIVPSQTLQIRGAPNVELRLPGVARIRAVGPTDSADEARQQWQSATSSFGELISGYGTQDLGELESLAETAKELESELGKSNVRLETLLDGDEVSTLRSERDRFQVQIEEILLLQPHWRDQPPDAAELASAAEQSRADYERDVGTAEQRADAADGVLKTAQQSHVEFHERKKSSQRRLTEILEELVRGETDGLSAPQRQQKLNELALAWRAENANLSKQQEEVAKLGDDPNETVSTLRQQRESLRNQAADADRALIRAETQLQQVIDDAPYSALAEVEEQIERLADEIAREQLNNEAIHLLHVTFAEQKRNALAAVVGPVQMRANRTLQRIVGGRFEGIEFDESLLPTGVRPATFDETVVLDYLSGGEQEQIHFAVRLALADTMFGEERQLVVLDDAFTATDRPRLARVIKILEEAAERYQILLLSCHPERYRHLNHVEFFDLVELRDAACREVT